MRLTLRLQRVTANLQPFTLRFLILVFVLLAGTYNVITPIGEADHELSHFRYIRYLQTHYRLPPLDYVWPAPPTQDQCNPLPEMPEHQFRQPPLYYTLASIAFSWLDISDLWWPDSNLYGYHAVNLDGGRNAYVHSDKERFPYRGIVLAVHLIRGFSTLLGVVGLFALYRTGRLLFSRAGQPVAWQRRGALLLTAAVAFNPTYLFASATITNDIMVGVLGLWTVYFALRTVLGEGEVRSFALMIVFFALAVLSKYSAVMLVPVLFLTTLVFLARQVPRVHHLSWRDVTRAVPFIVLVAALVGWWFWRNLQLYGYILPGYALTVLSLDYKLRVLRAMPLPDLLALLREGLHFTFLTYWGLLGADALTLPDSLINALRWVVILIGVGFAWRLVRRDTPATLRWVALGAILAIGMAWAIAFLLLFYAPRGRYLLSLYALFAFLLVWGASAWSPRRRPWLGAEVFVGLLFLVGVYAPFGVIRPAYQPPPIASTVELQPGEVPVYARVDDLAELVAVRVNPRDIRPGQEVEVTLVWRVLNSTSNNYLVGVHMETVTGAYLGGTAHFPARGNYATSLWQPGDVFRDTYRFTVQPGEDVALPVAARAKITVYCRTAERDVYLPMYDEQGNAIGDQVYSPWVRVGPAVERDALSRLGLIARFGEAIGLVAVEGVPDNPITAPAPVRLRFRWLALTKPDRDYTLFVQVLDEENRVWLGVDRPITGGYYPTGLWQPGETVDHEHRLDLAQLRRTLPPGHYRMVAGLYDPRTMERLPVHPEQGRADEVGYILAEWDVPAIRHAYLPFVRIAVTAPPGP